MLKWLQSINFFSSSSNTESTPMGDESSSIMINQMVSGKTGECYYIDESGQLWIAISYQNELGEVHTVQIEFE